MDPYRVAQACLISVLLLAGCGFLVWRVAGPLGRKLWRFTSLSVIAFLIAAWAVGYSVHRPAIPDVVRDARGQLVGFTDYNIDVVGSGSSERRTCSRPPGMMRGAREVGRLDVGYDRTHNEWVGTIGRSGTLPIYLGAPVVGKVVDPGGTTTFGPAVRSLFVVAPDGCQFWVNPGTVGF